MNPGAKKTLIACVSLILCLSGCSPTPGQSSKATPSPTTKPIVYAAAPLTGILYEEGTNPDLAGPAVMAKIDNSEAARPQSGLNKTDIVFDEMVEGGLTRFLAVWHSQIPDTFGPVRSVRPMDPDIASPLGGILCFSGGQKIFVQAMAKTNVYSATETNQQSARTFRRVKDREAPHNVFVLAHKLQHLHSDLAAPKDILEFAVDAAASSASLTGTAVTKLTVTFPAAQPTYTWNATQGLWLRSYGRDKHVDVADGKQIHTANVVVLKTKIDRSYPDPKYNHIPRTVLIGGGNGWLFSNGKKISISWTKAKRTDPIHLVDKAGNPVLLAPGNTWFELMPRDSGKLTVVSPPTTPTPTATPTP